MTVWCADLDETQSHPNLHTLTEVFPSFFLSCKANARVKLTKTGHGPHSSTLVVICVVRLLFVLFYVLFVCKCVLPPGDNATAVNKYVISSSMGTVLISRAVRRPRHFGYSPPSGAEVKDECSYTSAFLICPNVVDRDNVLPRPLPRDSFCSISCSTYVPWY